MHTILTSFTQDQSGLKLNMFRSWMEQCNSLHDPVDVTDVIIGGGAWGMFVFTTVTDTHL